jgi:HAE1 family hydrophobic/amphiphilic exporter-1
MSLSDVAIKRPIFATMLNAVLIVFGLFGYSKIGIDQFPDVDFPVVIVQVVYPGADPASVEQKILEPLERGLAGLQQLETMTSSAFPNIGQIALQFKLERDGDKAAQDVRDKMSALLGELPLEAEPPIIQKFDIAGQPIVIMSLTSTTVPFAELSRLADDVTRPALEQVNGVGNVSLIGNRERQIHVNLLRPKMQAFGISPMQVQDAISSQISEIPSGRIESRQDLIRIRTEGTISRADEIARLPINLPSGATIRISDIASVVDTMAREESYAALDGTSTILLSVFKQTGGNTVAVAKGIHEQIEELGTVLPEGVVMNLVKDNSNYIKGLIDAVELDLILGALLAVIIVWVFLYDWRATVISALAIPTSVIGTLAFINYLGFTLNMMTTLALTLSIGILVDDAIVVIENIYRHIRMGKSPMVAAREGTNEIALAVFAITLSIISVFVPVAFMEGIVGRFFYQFGLTVAIAVCISLFVAFTLTPMLSAKILKNDDPGSNGHHHVPRFFMPVDRFLIKMDRTYARFLGLALQHRLITISCGIVVLIISGILLGFVPKAFFPKEDRGEVNIVYEMQEGTAIQAAKTKANDLAAFLGNYPGVKQVVMFLGSGIERKPNIATFELTLVAKDQRTFSQDELILRLREELSKKVQASEHLEVNAEGGGGGKPQPIQVILQGNDFEQLRQFTAEMKNYVETQVEGTADVTTTEPKLSDEIRVVTQPLQAADLGLSTTQIGVALRSMFEGIKIGEILDQGLRYDVQMQVDESFRQNPQDLSGLMLPNNRGVPVDIASVSHVEVVKAPAKIERRGGQKQIMILANFVGQDEGGAVSQIREELQKRIPKGMSFSFDGSSKLFQDAVAAIVTAMVLAILLVYMVLCAQFESFLTPFVIMMSVPLAFSGAFLGLLVTQKTMSIYAMIGLIMLVGLVTKNAILLIDFTWQGMRAGKGVNEALLEAGPIRLRPILMTTAAMIFGMLPIAIGHGTGGEARSPMAICVIGGLISSTLLTLVVIPCIFSVLQGALDKRKGFGAWLGQFVALAKQAAGRFKRSP